MTTDDDHFRRSTAWALVALTVVGAALRGVGLNQQLWYDEIVTVMNTIRIPLVQLVSSYGWDNQHTFYSVLAQLSVALFGEHAWSVRLPAMIAGTLSIPALYLLGRSVFSRRESFCAASLLAVSYHHIWFSQNARGYSILMLATVIATWCFLEGQKRPGYRLWIVYAVTVALGAYTHLTMVFVAVSHMMIVVAQWIAASIQGKDKAPLHRTALAIVASGLLTIVLYGPMMGDIWNFFSDDRPKVASEWTKITWAIGEALRGLQMGYGLIVLLGLAVIGAIGVWRFGRTSPVVLALILLPGFVGLGVMVAAGRNIWPRFFLYVFGNALLIVVHGIWGVADVATAMVRDTQRRTQWRLAIGYGLCAIAIGQSFRMLPPLYQIPKQDMIAAIAYVEKERLPTDRVATVGLASDVFQRFYHADWSKIENDGDLGPLLASDGRVWVVSMFPIHLKSHFPIALERLDKDFETAKTLPATVGGGQVRISVRKR